MMEKEWSDISLTLYLIFWESINFLSIKYAVSCIFCLFVWLVVFVDILYQVGEGPPTHGLLSVCIMNEYWILSKAFPFIDMIIRLFSDRVILVNI